MNISARTSLLLLMLLMPTMTHAQSTEEPRALPAVDLERYAGTWYEIARIPNRFQNDCVGAATATYGLRDDGRIDVINRCLEDDGEVNEIEGIARLDKKGEARLEVSFFSILGWRPIWGDYWILDLGEEYETSVVGEGSRKYGWVLSRTPTVSDERLAELMDALRDQGYDPEKFDIVQGTGLGSPDRATGA
ncbi:MAG: lipocalin family protein [marine benthic group bacterium]|nr:lipocalin family protein [Gemmatimonadota bacterium]